MPPHKYIRATPDDTSRQQIRATLNMHPVRQRPLQSALSGLIETQNRRNMAENLFQLWSGSSGKQGNSIAESCPEPKLPEKMGKEMKKLLITAATALCAITSSALPDQEASPISAAELGCDIILEAASFVEKSSKRNLDKQMYKSLAEMNQVEDMNVFIDDRDSQLFLLKATLIQDKFPEHASAYNSAASGMIMREIHKSEDKNAAIAMMFIPMVIPMMVNTTKERVIECQDDKQ